MGNSISDDSADINRLRALAGITARQRQDLVDAAIEPVHLGNRRRRISLNAGVCRRLLDGLKPEAHAGERGAQMMRSVCRYLLLSPEEPRQSLGRAVERPCDNAHLGGARRLLGARLEVIGEHLCDLSDSLKRPGDRMGDDPRNEGRRNHYRDDKGAQGPSRALDDSIDLRLRERETSGGHDAFVLDDRCRDVAEVDPQGRREAHVGRELAAEGRGDLGSIEGPVQGRLIGVGDQLECSVDHDHARSGALGDRFGGGLPLILRLRGEDRGRRHRLHLKIGDKCGPLIVVDDKSHGHGEAKGDKCDQASHREDESSGHNPATAWSDRR